MCKVQQVILVDSFDKVIGTAEKLSAHEAGQLHRAVSVWLFNQFDQTLLQRRALQKYLSAGKWSNTCCTHPEPTESTEHAARRQLHFEMGISTELYYAYKFIYRAELENGLIEHEFDHVFFGYFEGEPAPNVNEVMEWAWMDLKELDRQILMKPRKFSEWLKIMWKNHFRSSKADLI
jgi:isopentenyl-diphosphate delta-isomerase